MRALTLRGRLRTAVGTVLLAMAGALGLAQDAAAQRELRVEDFSVTLTVHEDGTMDVLESIRYGFTGSWNGVFRDIPISYQSPSGLNFRLVLDDISVRNEAGETLRFETSRERHYRRIKVWVPGAQNTSRTVDFRYTVKNPLRFFDGEGEGFSGGYDELIGTPQGTSPRSRSTRPRSPYTSPLRSRASRRGRIPAATDLPRRTPRSQRYKMDSMCSPCAALPRERV